MNPLISSPSDTWQEVVNRLPEHRCGVNSLCEEFSEAKDLVRTNPALALCISLADSWDTLCRQSVTNLTRRLLRAKRRKACELLGFPGTEATVQILAKIQPEACSVPRLMRLRRPLKIPGLSEILCHMPAIREHELTVAAFWDCGGFCTVKLFQNLSMRCLFSPFPPNSLSLLRDTAELQAELRLETPPPRTMAELRERNRRLTKKLAGTLASDCGFPLPPFAGTETIIPVNTLALLIQEGIDQANCVAKRRHQIRDGICYIYRILAPERGTLEIVRTPDGWVLGEIEADHNRPIGARMLDAVRPWLEDNHIGTSCAYS